MTKKRRPIVYPKDNEKKEKETIQTLKSRLRRLEKDKKRLISEVKTLEKAFAESIKKINELTKERKLEQLLEIERHIEQTSEPLTEKERVRKKFADLNKNQRDNDEGRN